MTDEIFEEIRSIHWFACCGESGLDNVLTLDSWNDCISSFSSQEWDETTLEASNAISSLLHQNHIDAYRDAGGKVNDPNK